MSTIAATLEAHRAGASPEETIAQCYARIRAHNDPAIFITLRDEADALAEAEDAGEAGGVEDVELDELHAASARQPTVAATARKLTGRMLIRHVPPENHLMQARRPEEEGRIREREFSLARTGKRTVSRPRNAAAR